MNLEGISSSCTCLPRLFNNLRGQNEIFLWKETCFLQVLGNTYYSMTYLAFLIVSHSNTCLVTIKQAMNAPELSKQNLKTFIIAVGLACLQAFKWNMIKYAKLEVGNLRNSVLFLNICRGFLKLSHFLPDQEREKEEFIKDGCLSSGRKDLRHWLF